MVSVGLELIGIILVVISIIYSFIKKKELMGLALIIVLLMLLYLLGYLN
ncbi:MAG: hypothetical protein AABX61_03775 [Nanoarchaeota archaeon]